MLITPAEADRFAPNLVRDLELELLRFAFPAVMAYLAGPPVMVEAATSLLSSLGLPPRNMHADAFYNQA